MAESSVIQVERLLQEAKDAVAVLETRMVGFQATADTLKASRPVNCDATAEVNLMMDLTSSIKDSLSALVALTSGFLVEANKLNVQPTSPTTQFKMDIAAMEAAAEVGRHQSHDGSKGVFFNAGRTTTFRHVGCVINYDFVRLNVGNGLDATTGVFTAPVGGVYAFHFNGYYKDIPFTLSDHAEVNIYLNGSKLIGKTSSSHKYGSLSFSVVLNLVSGDSIAAVLRMGHVFDNRNMHTQFSGYLLKKDESTS